MKKLAFIAVAAALVSSTVLAGQVPNPINAPITSPPSGHILMTTANPQQVIDGGVLGTLAGKGTGTSVVDPGTGLLETVLPVQTTVAASRVFTASDLYKETRRSNSGSAMTDTFPASTATGLVNGTRIVMNNVDATASDTITAGAGTTINSGVTATVGPLRSVTWVYDAPNTMWRSTLNGTSAALTTVANTFSAPQAFSAITVTTLNGYTPQYAARQDGATSSAITAAGSGYAVGEVVTLNDGCSIHIKVAINNINAGASNAVTGFNIAFPGQCAQVPTNPVAQLSTTGSGTGATFTLLYGPLAATVPTQPLSTGGGNFIMNSPGSTEYTGGTYAGSESVFLGDRSGGVIGTGSFDVAIGHNATGIGGGCLNIYVDSSTVVGADAARNLCGGQDFTLYGASALKNFTQTGTSANHYLFGVTAIGGGAMLNFNGAVGFPWDTAVGFGACSGATNSSFINTTCLGSNSGRLLTTASNVLLLAGGGNGVDTCTSCSKVIDILSGGQTSTLSATASNAVNIENVITITGTNALPTALTTIAGPTIIAGAGTVVASLPTCNSGTKGARSYVTDATAPTYLGALTGGGAVVSQAFCNGSAWVSASNDNYETVRHVA